MNDVSNCSGTVQNRLCAKNAQEMEVLMGRYYHLSKKLTKAQVAEVEREMREIEDVESVEVNGDHMYMKVIKKDDEFSGVMGRAVNICSRVADGAELSFSGFAV